MSEPKVDVIAATVLNLPAIYACITQCAPHQDEGSYMARLVEFAGRTCYDSYGKGRDSAGFHEHLREVAHLSVLEHASFSFFISGISRGCSHELVRHRVGVAISQRSTRYVDESESEWCWHPALLGHSFPECEDLARRSQDLYRDIVRFLEPCVGRKQARGAARGVLGNALSTELVWTANLRALRHFLELRATDHADAEIRILANKLYEAALPYCPEHLDIYERVRPLDGMGYCLELR